MKEPQRLTIALLEAGASHSTIAHDCGCGILHVATHGNDGCFEPGEMKGYDRRAKERPGTIVFHDYSSLSVGWIGGQLYVMDCQCLEDRFGEKAKSLWDHRHTLMRFYTRHSEFIREHNQRTLEALAVARQAMEKGDC